MCLSGHLENRGCLLWSLVVGTTWTYRMGDMVVHMEGVGIVQKGCCTNVTLVKLEEATVLTQHVGNVGNKEI